jgi:uncharacterized protein (TIGR02246 family)
MGHGDREAIRAIIGDINRAWLEGRFEDLQRCFHPDMVIVAPGFAQRLAGAAACADTYREFMAAATIHAFEASPADVDVWGDTAVASYAYDIDYEMSGRRQRERGRDLFVFTRADGRWRAVWRGLADTSPAE